MAKIKWHDSAREHLRKIFEFNFDNMSEAYAYSVLGEVLDEVHIVAVWDVRQNPQTLVMTINTNQNK